MPQVLQAILPALIQFEYQQKRIASERAKVVFFCSLALDI